MILHRRATVLTAILIIASAITVASGAERVRVSPDNPSFVLADSGKPFTPFGFNYDHNRDGRLIEDYWNDEWKTVEEDFAEMKELGANVVRIHLQFGKFMQAADKPNEKALAKLEDLLKLSERTGLYLDLTGLGCYHKKDVPPWYDELDEAGRWAAQAAFWEAVANRCKDSSAVFCYDLMNEPVVPGGKGKQENWLGPAFGDKHFVQFVTRGAQGRPRHEIAAAWIKRLVAAIRKHDENHLITVGLVPWSLDRPGLTSGFIPDKVASELDFIAVHLYPKKGKLDEAFDTLKGFDIGKPVVIEEMFPLECSADELGDFIEKSRPSAAGWIGFYWGKTPAEYESGGTIADAITRSWLELFQNKAKEMKAGAEARRR